MASSVTQTTSSKVSDQTILPATAAAGVDMRCVLVSRKQIESNGRDDGEELVLGTVVKS